MFTEQRRFAIFCDGPAFDHFPDTAPSPGIHLQSVLFNANKQQSPTEVALPAVGGLVLAGALDKPLNQDSALYQW